MKQWIKKGLISLFVLLVISALGLGIVYWQWQRAPKILYNVKLQNKEPLLIHFFLKSGKKLAALDHAHHIELFDTKTGFLLKEYAFPSLSKVSISKNFSKIVGATTHLSFLHAIEDLNLSMLDIETGEVLPLVTYAKEKVPPLLNTAFINHDNQVVALYENYVWLTWDAKTRELSDKTSLDFLKPKKPLPACTLEWEALSNQEVALSETSFLEQCALRKASQVLEPLVSLDGIKLLLGNVEEEQVELWDMKKAHKICNVPKDLISLYSFKNPHELIDFSSDSQHLLFIKESESSQVSGLWLRTQDCQVEQNFILPHSAPSKFSQLPNQNFIFQNKLKDSFIWNPKTNQIFFPFQTNFYPSSFPWLKRFFPDALATKEWLEENPMIQAIAIDEEAKMIRIYTENEVTVWSPGNDQDLFF